MHDPCAVPREHPARAISIALGERATEFCRVHLPQGHREGRFWRAGDVHGAPGRALWVCLAPPGRPGRWGDNTTGARGDLLDLLRRRLGGVSLARAIETARVFLDAAGPVTTPPLLPSQQDPDHRADAAIRLWNLCRSLDGSHAERYLRALGLEPRQAYPWIRFHPRLFHRDANDAYREFPGLVAAALNDAGELTGVERVYLDPYRPARADVAQPSKSLGRTYGCRVPLGQTGPVLLVTRGVESALALRTACPDLPAAATLTVCNLASFNPPRGVQRLLIARDNDSVSAKAAKRLVERCHGRTASASVFAPNLQSFNDDLVVFGPEALATRICAKTSHRARSQSRTSRELASALTAGAAKSTGPSTTDGRWPLPELRSR